MQVVLVLFTAEGERRSFSLPRSITVIGRREDCDLRIPLGDVSRKHCRFIVEQDKLRLEDLGSSNGTYHNGVRITQAAMVNPGDLVQVGPVVFTVQVDGVPADDEIQPGPPPAAAGDTNIAPAMTGEDVPPPELPAPGGRTPQAMEAVDTLETVDSHAGAAPQPAGGAGDDGFVVLDAPEAAATEEVVELDLEEVEEHEPPKK